MIIELTAPEAEGDGPRLKRAVLTDAAGLMLLRLVADLPGLGETDLIDGPPVDEAVARLAEANQAFLFGGALLAPFANRVRGRLEGEEIVTEVLGREVRLPANWSGQASGAERYVMHGLILDAPARKIAVSDHEVRGVVLLDRPCAWPSRLEFRVRWTLEAGALVLSVMARNTGEEETAVGIGWHPWFRVPSGERAQARLTLPSTSRVLVNNYDDVLPTGEIREAAGSVHDFAAAGGAALNDLYLDDCFTGIAPPLCARLTDPAGNLQITVTSTSPAVRNLQVYAPPDKAVVVLEPQFNRPDPLGEIWAEEEHGMVQLKPGEASSYDVRVEIAQSDACQPQSNQELA